MTTSRLKGTGQPPAPQRLPPEQWRPVIRRVLVYMRPHRKRWAAAVLCVMVSSVLGLVPALAIRSIVDHLTRPHTSFGPVLGVIALALLATLVAALLGVAQGYLTLSVSEQVVAKVRGELFDHLIAQSVGYFTRHRAGEAVSRILNDAGGIDNMMGPTMIALASSAFSGVAAVALMFYLDWRLAVLSLAMAPVVALCLRLSGRVIFRARRRVQDQFSELTAYLHETLGISGIHLIKSFARERQERARFAEMNRTLRDLQVQAGMASQWFGVAMRLLQLAGPASLVLAGGYLVAHHELSLGGLLAFSLVALNFAGAVQTTANGLLTIIGSLALWQRIFTVLDHVPEVQESPHAHVLPAARGAIQMESVVFSYPGQTRPALSDISLDIRPGELAALVGPSGAGKTTLSHLLARFFDPQHGRVLLDGHDLRELTFESLGAAVGLVLQDSYLIHASLRENLSYGRADADDDALLEAAGRANLTDVIAGLPDGLDTLVGERGHRLSGGEKQRVAIARAVLKDPPILILDEATSHLDSVSEQLVQAALGQLLRGRTSVVIAHRLSTILAADQIIVLDHGTVVQTGTHQELVGEPGLYRQLYETQFASHVGGSPDLSLRP
jgi:ATP-binding cassette subfamily B protein